MRAAKFKPKTSDQPLSSRQPKVTDGGPLPHNLAGTPRVVAERDRNAARFGPVLQPAAPGGLPPALRSGVEALSGVSMEGVQLRQNSSEPGRIGALAFAIDPEIHLAPGADRHLPHEAWHIAQQRQGRVQATGDLGGAAINADQSLESEADHMGQRALTATQSTTQFVRKNTAKRPVLQGLFNITLHEVEGQWVVATIAYLRDSSQTTGGPHVTPNSLFVHQVKMMLTGKSFVDGFNALKSLYSERLAVFRLRPDPRKNRIADLATKSFEELSEIDPSTVPPPAWVPVLQQLALAYIQMRNSRVGAILPDQRGHKEPGEENERVVHQSAQSDLKILRIATAAEREEPEEEDAMLLEGSSTALDVTGDFDGDAEPEDIERERRSKLRRTQPLVSVINDLATKIADWADYAATRNVDAKLGESILGRVANRFRAQGELMRRHFDDAMIALGISGDETVLINGNELNLRAVLMVQYDKAMPERFPTGTADVRKGLNGI